MDISSRLSELTAKIEAAIQVLDMVSTKAATALSQLPPGGNALIPFTENELNYICEVAGDCLFEYDADGLPVTDDEGIAF